MIFNAENVCCEATVFQAIRFSSIKLPAGSQPASHKYIHICISFTFQYIEFSWMIPNAAAASSSNTPTSTHPPPQSTIQRHFTFIMNKFLDCISSSSLLYGCTRIDDCRLSSFGSRFLYDF